MAFSKEKVGEVSSTADGVRFHINLTACLVKTSPFNTHLLQNLDIITSQAEQCFDVVDSFFSSIQEEQSLQ